MTKEILKRCRSMVRVYGFDNVAFLSKWNDSEVIEPIFEDDEDHFIGLPQYILVKG